MNDTITLTADAYDALQFGVDFTRRGAFRAALAEAVETIVMEYQPPPGSLDRGPRSVFATAVVEVVAAAERLSQRRPASLDQCRGIAGMGRGGRTVRDRLWHVQSIGRATADWQRWYSPDDRARSGDIIMAYAHALCDKRTCMEHVVAVGFGVADVDHRYFDFDAAVK